MAIPAYPVILTQADWTKKKGLFAKAKETGLGALMTECERQYKAVAWAKFDVRKVLAGGATGTQAQEGYMDAYKEGRHQAGGHAGARSQRCLPGDEAWHPGHRALMGGDPDPVG